MAKAPVKSNKQQSSGVMSGLSLTRQLCLLLVVSCCLLYANTLYNGYAVDDPVMIEKNKFVTQGIKAIPQLFATPHLLGFYEIPNDLYRPLSLVTFAIEYQFFGASALTGHLFNIIIYAIAIVLLFLFLDRFFERKRTIVAFLAALLFAVHPIHTEVVANIKSRDELLCFLLGFLSLNLFMKYMKSGQSGSLAAGACALFFAYLSKETVIAFAVIIPLIVFFQPGTDRKRAVYVSTCSFAATLLFLAIRAYVLGKYHTGQMTVLNFIDNSLAYAPSLTTRIATEVTILGQYLKLLMVPYPLLSDYAYNSIPYASPESLGFLLSLAVYFFLIYTAIKRWIKRNNDPWAFSIIFYLATLFLVSNLPFLIAGEMAERFLFFPSVGFCLAAALATERWLTTERLLDLKSIRSTRVLAVLVPVTLLFSMMTVARNNDWKDDYTLFKTDSEKSPKDSRLHHHLAAAIQLIASNETDSIRQRSLRDDALAEYKKALQIFPGYVATLSDISHLYFKMKINDSAELYFKKLLEANAQGDAGANTIAANIVANIDFNAGRYQEALVYFRKALNFSPRISYSYLNIAETYLKLNAFDSAIDYIYKTLAADSVYGGEHIKLANTFVKMNQYDSAVYHLQQHAAIRHSDYIATNDIGIFYFNLKKYPEAIDQFKKTINTNPNFISAYANLGTCYFITGKYDSSVAIFKRELSVAPNNVQDLPYLAVSFLKAGQRDSALKYEAIIKQMNPNFRLPQ